MPTLLEVWQSRLGIHEISGREHNAIILQWWRDAGHPEIIDDEIAWCSGSMCSAAKEAGLPFPPPNVNPMARSWLTMGVRVAPGDVQPGDVVVWPRGAPPAGHVNCVQDVRARDGKIEVRCIGGNQSHKSRWRRHAHRLDGHRRRARPTASGAWCQPLCRTCAPPAAPPSSGADTDEKLGIIGSFFVPIFEGVHAVIEEHVRACRGARRSTSLPDGLTWWGAARAGQQGRGSYAVDQPMAGGHPDRQHRHGGAGQAHQAGPRPGTRSGVPIASQVAALGEPDMGTPKVWLAAAGLVCLVLFWARRTCGTRRR